MVRLDRAISLILLSLLFSIFVGSSTPPANSALVGSGIIKIQSLDYSAGVAKILFVFDEETGSNDFHERSTTWIMANGKSTYGIPIGRADPDWVLLGTNDVTLWHWKLEKLIDLEYSTFHFSLTFPYEEFTTSFYVISNITRFLSVVSEIPNYDARITQRILEYNQTSLTFQPEGCPNLVEVTIQISHDVEYRIIVNMSYAILVLVLVTAFLLFKTRRVIGLSNYIMSSLTILIFLPIFFFTFRESLSPKYLTIFDGLFFFTTAIYGMFLIAELSSHVRRSNSMKSHNVLNYE